MEKFTARNTYLKAVIEEMKANTDYKVLLFAFVKIELSEEKQPCDPRLGDYKITYVCAVNLVTLGYFMHEAEMKLRNDGRYDWD